jgi:hypothetical protein
MMRQVIGHNPSAKTIERLTRRVGAELTARGGAASERREVIVADVAVVSCDGGRIRTRAANARPGVHEAAWRETKNSSFERMKASAPSAVYKGPLMDGRQGFRGRWEGGMAVC